MTRWQRRSRQQNCTNVGRQQQQKMCSKISFVGGTCCRCRRCRSCCRCHCHCRCCCRCCRVLRKTCQAKNCPPLSPGWFIFATGRKKERERKRKTQSVTEEEWTSRYVWLEKRPNKKANNKNKAKASKERQRRRSKGKKASGDETRKHSELSKKILLLQK